MISAQFSTLDKIRSIYIVARRCVVWTDHDLSVKSKCVVWTILSWPWPQRQPERIGESEFSSIITYFPLILSAERTVPVVRVSPTIVASIFLSISFPPSFFHYNAVHKQLGPLASCGHPFSMCWLLCVSETWVKTKSLEVPPSATSCYVWPPCRPSVCQRETHNDFKAFDYKLCSVQYGDLVTLKDMSCVGALREPLLF